MSKTDTDLKEIMKHVKNGESRLEEMRRKENENIPQLLSLLPEVLAPYAIPIKIHEHGAFGRFRIIIPGFSLITAHVSYIRKTVRYFIHGGNWTVDDLEDMEIFEKSIVERDVFDYQIALAIAHQLAGEKIGNDGKPVKDQIRYEPFSEDLIDSDGKYDSPLAFYWSEYTMREMERLIEAVVDRRLKIVT